MIRINLLGAQKGKNKRSAASAAAVMEVGDVGSPKLKILVVLVLAGLVNVGYWYQLDKQHRDIAAKMEVAVRKNAELADVKARYLERQREAENYKRRVDVIDQLRAAQAGPVNLLNTIGQTVNSTEAVWLNTMKDSGRQRRYRRHGPEHRRGGQSDLEPAKDRILQEHRNQRDLPGRHL